MTITETPAGWVTVRCPACRNNLGEVRGDLRRICPNCKGTVIYTSETGETILRRKEQQ